MGQLQLMSFIECKLVLGRFYMSQGKNNKAKDFLLKSVQLAEKSNDLPRQFENSRDLSHIYKTLGMLEDAEQILNKILSTIEITINRHDLTTDLDDLDRVHRYQAEILESLGHHYRNQGKFDEAEQAHKKALTINNHRNSLGGKAHSWCNLGMLYRDKEDFEKAEEAFRKSQDLRYAEKSNSGTCIHELGMLYKKQGKLNEAEQALIEAIKIYERRVIHILVLQENGAT